MKSKLQRHNRIGWDFDGVLINHLNSARFVEYINSHPAKDHFIVTHRSHGLEKQIWRDLERHGLRLHPSMIEDIINVDDHLWETSTRAEALMRAGQEVPEELAKAAKDYIDWKAITCKKHGITVLIDDRADDFLESCNLHGVDLIHPDDLT